MALSVNIRKQLGDFHLEAQFEAGNELLALLGASGCGKSVTLRCIAGILTPDSGKITLDGTVLYDSAAGVNLPPQRRQVGYLFQQYALFPNMTVRQNIAVAVRDRDARSQVTAEKLQQFQLEAVADQFPRQLSGGQQQRCALARILASRPAAILLDEPFSALDSYLKAQLELELMDTLADFSGTVLWVSHDRGEVFRNCDQVCVMDHGSTQAVTSMEELFRRPATEAAARLSGCQNYTDAVPQGSTVFLPAWGLTLSCGRPVPEDVHRAGIRARCVRLSSTEEENSFSCQVIRVVEDLSAMVVLLRPLGAALEAPLLRMELEKTVWKTVSDQQQIRVAIASQDLLLF